MAQQLHPDSHPGESDTENSPRDSHSVIIHDGPTVKTAQTAARETWQGKCGPSAQQTTLHA